MEGERAERKFKRDGERMVGRDNQRGELERERVGEGKEIEKERALYQRERGAEMKNRMSPQTFSTDDRD